jgi:anaerobic sulfite reductase subunit B
MRAESDPTVIGHDSVRDVPADPFVPRWCRVADRAVETDDVVSLLLEDPLPPVAFRPGQFNMLTAFGVGEVAISVSSEPDDSGMLHHTIRDVGAVTHALCGTPVDSFVGVRGPYGTDWGITDLRDGDVDVVVVAGGIGLAPLRGAITTLSKMPSPDSVRLFVAVGAREPNQVIFATDLAAWRAAGATVELTVDAAPSGWDGHVGLVTTLLPRMDFDPARTVALICGPEIMMRFVARDLLDRGVTASQVRISLERNTQCGTALCGHCQLGPVLLCRDGPVMAYSAAAQLMLERER